MIKEYFSLTSSERNGLFALFMLVLVLLIVLKVRQYTYEPELVDLSALEDSVMKFYSSPLITEEEKPKVYKQYTYNKTTSKAASPKPPKVAKPLVIVEINSASAKELTQIKGIGAFYAKNIIEQRKCLGGFSKVEQLLCVYGMTQDRLDSMQHQIRIDTSLCLAKVPMNSADSFLLAETYIIDTYLASSIVRYRERLGGFYDSRQLLEIFSIDEELYESLMCRLYLDTVSLRYLDVNNADFKTVMKHPYINGYKNTKAIFRYLEYGGIKTWEEFCKIPNLALDNPDGLRYYVKFLPVIPDTEEVDNITISPE